jgi:hypothetical protein
MGQTQAMTSRKLVHQPIGPVDKRRRKRGLTIAIRTAIDAMIYDRCTRAEACERAGITTRALYLAFEKSEVAAHFNRCLQVLRVGERAANFHRLTELRDQDSNMNAAVKAVTVLEELDAEATARPLHQPSPGIVIHIVSREPATPTPTIEHTPHADAEPVFDPGRPVFDPDR